MTDIEYAEFVDALFVNRRVGHDGILHATIGIAGEAGELLDTVKKMWVYNRELNRESVIEELGDLEYYLQALRLMLKVSRREIIQGNVDKLHKRYPHGYTDAMAAARLDKRTS